MYLRLYDRINYLCVKLYVSLKSLGASFQYIHCRHHFFVKFTYSCVIMTHHDNKYSVQCDTIVHFLYYYKYCNNDGLY